MYTIELLQISKRTIFRFVTPLVAPAGQTYVYGDIVIHEM